MDMQNIESLPPSLAVLPPRMMLRAIDINKPYVAIKGELSALESKKRHLWAVARKVGVKLTSQIIEDQLVIMKIE